MEEIFSFAQPPTIQTIDSVIVRQAGVDLSVLRLDVMHPSVNGNKWFKLKYNLLEARQKNFTTLLTFGGAYSNHIYATAAAGNLFGFRTIGVIRGEEHLPLNPTLSFAVQQGMQIVYIDRQKYRQRYTAELQAELNERFGEVFIIPEGGGNLNGVRGCVEILSKGQGEFCKQQFDTVCVACGTGSTLAGIVLSLQQGQRVIGFPVLKNGEFLAEEIESFLKNYRASGVPTTKNAIASWELVCNYHMGGYAKVNDGLLLFAQQFTQEHGIPLDYVYTAKLFYGVMDLLKQGFFPPGTRLLLIHTGGLQGNLGRG